MMKNKEWLNEDIELAIEKCLDKFFYNKTYNSPTKNFYYKILDYVEDENYKHENPWSVKWQITSKCNLRCSHCFFYKTDMYDSTNELNGEEILEFTDKIINELKITEIVITGGEPFLRSVIFKVIEKLKKAKVSIYLQTNATLLTPDISKKLKSLLNPRTDFIQVSLDGLEAHNIIRNSEIYNKTITGIENLLKYDIPTAINCTVTSKNQHDLPDLYEMVSNLGVEVFFISRFSPCHKDHISLIPDEEVILKAISKLIDLEKNNKTFFNLSMYKFKDLINIEKVKVAIDRRKDLNKKNNITKKDLMCHNHQNMLIRANSDIALCAEALSQGILLGNAREENLSKIWEKRYENLAYQPRLLNNMSCNKCNYLKLCNGGCPITGYKKYGNINAPDGDCVLGESLYNCQKSFNQ